MTTSFRPHAIPTFISLVFRLRTVSRQLHAEIRLTASVLLAHSFPSRSRIGTVMHLSLVEAAVLRVRHWPPRFHT
jgi:hypothetical protein